jgi:two-component system LytT family response regulator
MNVEDLPPRRVIIADDEPLARERIRYLITRDPRWTIVAECRNGPDTVDAILEHRPDVVFLDIRMPGLDGFEVAEAIALDDNMAVPIVVFVTAHDDFALRAFDISAIDYLLKPVDRQRFERTLARLETRLSLGTPASMPTGYGAVLSRIQGGRRYPQRFLVRSARGYYFVQAADVAWVNADGNYAALHAGGRVHLLRQTMKALEARLDPTVFVRVHRSAIVNRARVVRADRLGHGQYRLHLVGGAAVETSRAYNSGVRALLSG